MKSFFFLILLFINVVAFAQKGLDEMIAGGQLCVLCVTFVFGAFFGNTTDTKNH